MEFSALNNCLLFQGIKAQAQKAILSCLGARQEQFQKDEFLMTAGMPPKFGILLQGEAHIIREDILGHRSIIAVLLPGEMFGETLCCARLGESPVSVVCRKACQTLFLNFESLLFPCPKACGYHKQLAANLLKLMAQKNLLMSGRMAILEKRTIREKLLACFQELSLYQRNAYITLPFSMGELADTICADRSAVSRELSRMEKAGLIQKKDRQIVLLCAGKEGGKG